MFDGEVDTHNRYATDDEYFKGLCEASRHQYDGGSREQSLPFSRFNVGVVRLGLTNVGCTGNKPVVNQNSRCGGCDTNKNLDCIAAIGWHVFPFRLARECLPQGHPVGPEYRSCSQYPSSNYQL